ncbi:MAG: CRISPR-associated protein [Promethearchaeota archaeon]
MAERKLLIFDIKGDYGYFKIPETTRSPISFPFTRTSIIGVIGAILGVPRNSYWLNDNPLANSKIALELMNNIKHTSITINYTHTKNIISVGKLKTMITNYSKKGFRGFVTDVKLDLIKDIHYRIYFTTENSVLYKNLKYALENSEFQYPPYLGHAFLLADIEYLGEFSYKLSNIKKEIDTVIGVSQIDPNFLSAVNTKLTIIPNIPIRMVKSEKKNEISQTITEHFIIGDPNEKPWKILINDNTEIYEVNINDNTIRITFMPDGLLKIVSKPIQEKLNSNNSLITSQKKFNNSDEIIDINSRQILFLFDCRDSVPNGDRDPGIIGQRFDPETGRILITDVCLKRMIRDYIMNVYQNNPFTKILVHNRLYERAQMINLKNKFLEDLDKTEQDLKKMGFKEIKKLISKRFIDFRLFGGIFQYESELFAATGPVQFSISKSLNIPKITKLNLTTCLASKSEKAAGSMGIYSVVDYALILTYGIIKNRLAFQTKLKESDIKILYEGLWNGLKARITRTKINHSPRLLLSIIFKNSAFQIPGLQNSIQLEYEKIKSIKECNLKLDLLKLLLKKYQNKINYIEFIEDGTLKYLSNGNIYNSFADFILNENIEIQLKKINL